MRAGLVGAIGGAVLLTAMSCQRADAAGVAVAGSVAVVSDYRFRGIALSGGHPALQADVNLSEAGFSLDAWASNATGFGGREELEVDLSAGVERQLGPLRVGATLTYYSHPGFNEVNYFELLGHADHNFGRLRLSLQGGYIPQQRVLGHGSNRYVAIAIEHPIGPVTAFASFGDERGVFWPHGKRDWQFGLRAAIGAAELAISYTDTNRTFRNRAAHDLTGPACVASLKFPF